MGQEEVINFLKKQKEPLARGEIAEGMRESPAKITNILCKLIVHREIEFIEIDRLEAIKRCGCKRRMRLYFTN